MQVPEIVSEIMMRIATLGWGSLIWDPRDLPREGTWQSGGPTLPIEFSRISRDCRLTLVIDPHNGTPVATRFVLSPRSDPDDAISDLRRREETVSDRIGYVDLKHHSEWCRVHPAALEVIRTWERDHGFDAVVWTDLPANFQEETGEAFSLDAAERYLRRLPKGAADRARRYIQNAPPEVDTPLRRRLRETGWMQP